MLIRACMAKIHRATVTEADLDYVGSITVDEALLEASGMKPFQYVNITNVANGVFWQTYIIPGPRGNGDICLNGPPAHHFKAGDKVIILAETWLESSELKNLDPVVVFVDEKNAITEVKKHKAIPVVVKKFTEKTQSYSNAKKKTGLDILYAPDESGGITIRLTSEEKPVIEAVFGKERADEAHILYNEASDVLGSRAKAGQDPAAIREALETLFRLYRGEKVSLEKFLPPASAHKPSGQIAANPGKKIEIEAGGRTYLRLPIKTGLITKRDEDFVSLVETYLRPHLRPGDVIFVSEKALCITQNRIVDFGDIRPTPLARFLARNVGNYYGLSKFHGFGHGTALAMQLFIEEAGYARVLFAAAVAAVTRPLGIRGLFYRICGKRAKSIDCPMSFTIIPYAHSAKLAPRDPDGVARRIKERLGHEAVVLDANYRGAFSLGKSTRAISERFIGELFKDNPLGQSEEMTPFCIVRKKE